MSQENSEELFSEDEVMTINGVDYVMKAKAEYLIRATPPVDSPKPSEPSFNWPEKRGHARGCLIDMPEHFHCDCGAKQANQMHDAFMQVINSSPRLERLDSTEIEKSLNACDEEKWNNKQKSIYMSNRFGSSPAREVPSEKELSWCLWKIYGKEGQNYEDFLLNAKAIRNLILGRRDND